MELPKLEFPEEFRRYAWPDGTSTLIEKVTHVKVSSSGNHRLQTATGKMYIISPGWRYIEFKASEWSF